jgi:conjugative transposon TraM protein
MEKKIRAVRYAKQRKFLMILPLLTLPFLTMMFWAFGGGKGSEVVARQNRQQGLNLKLPDAKLKDDKALTKLSFYQQAALDSAKAKEAEKLDPYWNKSGDDSNSDNVDNADKEMDANQLKVYDKLDELKKVLNKNEEAAGNKKELNNNPYSMQSYHSSGEVERLRAMMQQINEDKTQDPEITQLNDMLDKIQAIQNPDQNKSVDKTTTKRNLTVKTKDHKAAISLLNTDTSESYNADTIDAGNSDNGFYGIPSLGDKNGFGYSNAMEAVIPETQTLVAGSTIKLTLSNDITIDHITLPSGTSVFGTTSVSNERLKIEINSIRFQNAILPVSLNVYDMDGQEGIYIPGSVTGTVAKESTNKALGNMDATIVDPSIGAQAASAGIEAAKTLVGKKVKLIKVTVKSGYKVLLKDSRENNF